MGGDLPVRVQSMTNTDTLDTAASVSQCIRIIEAGGELVRLTAQGVREAENLAAIRSGLRQAGFETPICADIHFNPSAAGVAARIVEKVRINPGNYADKRASFIRQDLTRSEWMAELERTRSRLAKSLDSPRPRLKMVNSSSAARIPSPGLFVVFRLIW